MDSISLLLANLISPPVIAFAAGVIAIFVNSDLKFPEQVYQALTIYLLLAIGFKGGSSMADSSFSELILPLSATIFMGLLIPALVFFATRKFLAMSVSNAAALAAHYGSVSAVTFMACLAFLEQQKMGYENFMPAIMAAMEIPAIFAAMLLAKRYSARAKTPLKKSIHEVITGKTFILLICGIVCGLTAGEKGKTLLEPFLIAPFYGVLMLFLLEMGLIAGSKLKELGSVSKKLVAFAIIAPIAQAILGLILGWSIGLSQGGAVIFAVLAASASYIAAPAAVRASLPNANPAFYVTTSLGITFPFNLVIGIPLYLSMSHLLYAS
ncbi:sodium-dependent bicarbonate transport family permease [Luteolibacter sp. AS25]|uniref:sodium-dependent bicarbonate transport family permease n=1 Tax=Luteolibacter sp. AS25 TaxID=3135776 RepID=UPI00398B90BB